MILIESFRLLYVFLPIPVFINFLIRWVVAEAGLEDKRL